MAQPSFYPARRIAPYDLWIGSKRDAYNAATAARRGVGLVVNCTRDRPFKIPGVRRVRVPVDDDPSESPVFLQHVAKAVQAIQSTLKNGRGVLVHCYAGISRSASVVAAFLMAQEGLTKAQAMSRIRASKPETFTPRANFGAALTAVENATRTKRGKKAKRS